MSDDTITTERACCPACRRAGRRVTVGFIVESAGLYRLTRRARGEEQDEIDAFVREYWKLVPRDAWAAGETYRRPLEGSRVPPVLTRTDDRTIRCRYGHVLRVPMVRALDLILEKRRRGEPVFLPTAKT